MAEANIRARSAQRQPASLLVHINRTIDRLGIAPSAFGRMVANDPSLLWDMANGRELRPQTETRIRRQLARMEANHGN